MHLSLVAAVGEDGGMGWQGGLPWRLPDDLKRFKQLTLGNPIIMGRRTWESIGRPLPGRMNIVVSTNPNLDAADCTIAPSLNAAVSLAEAYGAHAAAIIGGAVLYAAALPLVDTLHLTRVHAAAPSDTFFPAVPWQDFERVASEEHPADANHAHAFTFETWARRPAKG